MLSACHVYETGYYICVGTGSKYHLFVLFVDEVVCIVFGAGPKYHLCVLFVDGLSVLSTVQNPIDE